ncbi:protease pro-enzyme activation domain-containing protein [Ralstonia pickettii]|uniref:protease pro-enzyme activation domain-containing protein n=1 Tax=Ralstonia pickettii TaxID=329 RepID=UPI000AF5E59D
MQLRRPNEAELDARLSGFVHAHAAGTPPPTPLAREEWAAQFGATSDDIDAVRTFAREHSLQVVEVNVAAATVTLEGSVEQFCRAFDTHLHRVAHGDCEYRGRSGPLRLPESLQDVVVAALGLDSRPQASRIAASCRCLPGRLSREASGPRVRSPPRRTHRCSSRSSTAFRRATARASALRLSNAAAATGKTVCVRTSRSWACPCRR